MATLQVLGAGKTTTGSRHLLSWEGERHTRRILVDCGMFQGRKELRLLNREPFPVSPEVVDAVVLTHGHLDHVGWLPRLAREGFDGPVYGTRATLAVAEIILRDSAHIQEEDAKHARKWGYSKHKDPQPLYATQDVEQVLKQFEPLEYYRSTPLLEGCHVRMHHSGHILGSAFVELTIEERGDILRVVFSGDVGRFDQPILRDPEPPTGADYFILEGTYGDRTHSTADPLEEIEQVVNRTVGRGGTVVIPAFAVGRSQQLLHYLATLLEEKRIEPVDIFLDSPMAVRVTRSLQEHSEELDLQTLLGVKERRIFQRPEVHLLEKREESQQLNDRSDPCIIISASGMATAGRILHHMKRRITDPRNTILLVGYQGEGTRGRRLLEGEEEIKIHGQHYPVKAEVVNMSSLSAHADYTEMLPWLRRMVPPALTIVVHGEEESLLAWADRLERELGWHVLVPDRGAALQLAPVDPASRTLARPGPAREVVPPPVAVVVATGVEELRPAGIIAEQVYRESLDEELARRILAETTSRDIILLPGRHAGDGALALLRGEGRAVWSISEEEV